MPVDAAPPPHAAALLPWLLGCRPATVEQVPSAVEQQALALLDRTLALPVLPDDLLPRAAALVPQMLALLRQSDLPVPALAQRVSKDVVLTAEVLRLASGPYYRAQGGVTDLSQAISLIGVAGLNTVIARVVLKPIYDTTPGPLSARAAARLWEHAEVLAGHTAALAPQAGAAAFDGYLAGLLQGSGWTLLFRLLDRAAVALPLPPSTAFSVACGERALRLFGRASQRWSITPGFAEFGADARACPIESSLNPLAVALRRAQPVVMAELAPGTGST